MTFTLVMVAQPVCPAFPAAIPGHICLGARLVDVDSRAIVTFYVGDWKYEVHRWPVMDSPPFGWRFDLQAAWRDTNLAAQIRTSVMPTSYGTADDELLARVTDAIELGILSLVRAELALPESGARVSGEVVNLRDLVGTTPAGPTPAPATSAAADVSFEVALVDELGEPIADIPLVLLVDGGSEVVVTDANGRARISRTRGAFAAASFGNVDLLREPLRERWRTIRPGDWLEPTDARSVLQLRQSMPSVSLRADEAHTISVQPRVVLARLLGMFFDTDKTFLLPTAMAGIRGIKRLYDDNPGATLLAVGHTDTSGQAEHNQRLSLERGESVVAYLADQVDPWLAFYQPSGAAGRIWGSAEDLMMIGAMPDAATRPPSEDPVVWYQRTRGLGVDGSAGPETRRELIAEYMAHDQTSLPSDVGIEVHGCGEHFPATITEDGVEAQENRRVEIFFFEDEVMPAPPARTSGPGAVEPPEWQRRAKETHDFRPGQRILDPLALRWHASTVALVPAETVLVLTGEGIPEQRLPIVVGIATGQDVEFSFAHVDPDLPCSLTAKTDGAELVLWREQLVGSTDPPLRWEADLASLVPIAPPQEPPKPDQLAVILPPDDEPTNILVA